MIKEAREVKQILKDIKKEKAKSPSKTKNILKWTPGELAAYILKETKGMSIQKKFKFAKDLDKRIKDEKLKAGINKK